MRNSSFNPRARVGRDSMENLSVMMIESFQSTRPRGARRWACRECWSWAISFNPRARVGRDQSDMLT